jgi:hypothetical protein
MLRFLPLPFRATPARRSLFLPLGVVALLFSALVAPAQEVPSAADLIARPATVVEGVVTGVSTDGKIVTLLGGAGNLDIDVSNARIVLAGPGTSASGTPATIGIGARIVATIALGDAIPAVMPPPPLVATNVLVVESRLTFLHGMIQAVNLPGSAFSMLFRVVNTDANTEFLGGSSEGPIKSLADLAPGQVADVTVVASPLGLLAVRVVAHGFPAPPPLPFAFRGVVKTIAADQWTIGEKVVGITNETKIVGDPKVGDTVDVLAKVQNPPNPGMGMPSSIVAILITKVPVVTPPPTPGSGRDFTFEGPVQSIPSTPTQIGTWKIAGKDVVVTAQTEIQGSPKVGDRVRVTGTLMPGPAATMGSITLPMSLTITAKKIEKKTTGS